ncbi:unnamed protein product [Cuscuta europaea]|nr:unnamed protein product [Cuscuta europaea]
MEMLKPLWNDASTLELIGMAKNWGIVDVYVDTIDEAQLISEYALPFTGAVEEVVDTEQRVDADHACENVEGNAAEEEEDILPAGHDNSSGEEQDEGNNGSDGDLIDKKTTWVKKQQQRDDLHLDVEGEQSSVYYDSDDPPSYYSKPEHEDAQGCEVQSRRKAKLSFI